MLDDIQTIEGQTQHLIDDFWENHAILPGVQYSTREDMFPLDVGSVARFANYEYFEVQFISASKGVKALGEIDPIAREIRVLASETEERKRFTGAHELGHLRLHPGQARHRDDVHTLAAGRAQDRKEREANRFAGALLAPADLLTTEFQTRFERNARVLFEDELPLRFARPPIDWQNAERQTALWLASCEQPDFPSSLAARFGISNFALAIRLEELGLVARWLQAKPTKRTLARQHNSRLSSLHNFVPSQEAASKDGSSQTSSPDLHGKVSDVARRVFTLKCQRLGIEIIPESVALRFMVEGRTAPAVVLATSSQARYAAVLKFGTGEDLKKEFRNYQNFLGRIEPDLRPELFRDGSFDVLAFDLVGSSTFTSHAAPTLEHVLEELLRSEFKSTQLVDELERGLAGIISKLETLATQSPLTAKPTFSWLPHFGVPAKLATHVFGQDVSDFSSLLHRELAAIAPLDGLIIGHRDLNRRNILITSDTAHLVDAGHMGQAHPCYDLTYLLVHLFDFSLKADPSGMIFQRQMRRWKGTEALIEPSPESPIFEATPVEAALALLVDQIRDASVRLLHLFGGSPESRHSMAAVSTFVAVHGGALVPAAARTILAELCTLSRENAWTSKLPAKPAESLSATWLRAETPFLS